MKKEIERKFVLTTLPDHLQLNVIGEFHQSYLAHGNEEVRIRKIMSRHEVTHFLTIKKGSGMSRSESEFCISINTYNQLLNNSKKQSLVKKRYSLIHSVHSVDYLFEIDVYKDFPNLITVEVEFKSEFEALNFLKPEWFGSEVTYDKEYKNQSLWKKIQN